MKIKYLGTAAYEAVPALYCKCRVCKESFKTGGRALRSRAQALVDGELLLDFNADTVCHSLRYGIDWDKIGNCLITHSHCDHLYPQDIEILSDPISHEHRSLCFYAAEEGFRMISEQIRAVNMHNRVFSVLIKPGDKFKTSDGKYTVLVLRANHDESTSPVFYAIEREGKRLLYAHDTGIFFEETYTELKNFGMFDLVSLDCTGCLGKYAVYRDGHMSLKTNLEVIERMRKAGCVGEKTIFVANHFSHNGGQTYDEMVPEMAKYGIIVSYDGLEIDF